jgi:hypothetical protein
MNFIILHNLWISATQHSATLGELERRRAKK